MCPIMSMKLGSTVASSSSGNARASSRVRGAVRRGKGPCFATGPSLTPPPPRRKRQSPARAPHMKRRYGADDQEDDDGDESS
jgi:hypothetical protein